MKGRLRDPHNNYHVTCKGHVIPELHPRAVAQFYCLEKESTEHIHIGIQFKENVKGTDLLNWFKEEYKGEPDIKWHRNFGTVVGYHHGMGDKPACNGVKWQKGTKENYQLVKEKSKYTYKAIQQAESIQDLSKFLTRPGQWSAIQKDYMMVKTPKDLETIPEKRRHICVIDRSNTGKSIMVSENFSPLYSKTNDKWWDRYEQEQYIWFDEILPQWSHLKMWTGAARRAITVEVKGGFTWLTGGTIFIITLNHEPYKELFEKDSKEREAFENRFIVMNASDLKEYIREKMEDPVLFCENCRKMHRSLCTNARGNDHEISLSPNPLPPPPTNTPQPQREPSSQQQQINDLIGVIHAEASSSYTRSSFYGTNVDDQHPSWMSL